MAVGLLLDIVVIVVGIAAVITGCARGVLRALGSFAGLAAGGAAALFVMPFVSSRVDLAGWNVAAAVLAGLLLVGLGIGIGEGIARAIRRPVHRVGLGPIERLLGGAVSLAVVWATLVIFAMSVGSLGIPGATQAVSASKILSFVTDATPAPVESALSRLRAIVITDGIPTVLDAAGAGTSEVPNANADTAALRAASQSVPRITTNAPSCNTMGSGSGFIIDGDTVMTNAHVVAGARDVVVEAPGAFPRSASVVYFDPDADIAVLDVPGLGGQALPFAPTPETGSTVFFQGYPYGGPFTSRSAAVDGTQQTIVNDIYERSTVTRSVTRLAGTVEPGNSGGPVLTADGAVAGMIFARSDAAANVGYALSMEEISPVLALAPSLDRPVSTGACSS